MRGKHLLFALALALGAALVAGAQSQFVPSVVVGPLLQFVCQTSACPAIKRNGASIDVRTADDSSYASVTALRFIVAGSGSIVTGTTGLIFAASPSISSGFGSSPSVVANNGSGAFTVNVGTGGVATSGVLGLPTAATGWNCLVNDLTAAAGHVAYSTVQTASTTATATVENQTKSTGAAIAWAASDILRVSCLAY